MTDLSPEGAVPDRTSGQGPDVDAFPTWGSIGYGVLTAATGIVLLLWTSATFVVVVALLAVHLVVSGVVGLARALGPWEADTGERALSAITGALALGLAVLLIQRPQQTLTLAVLVIGAWWVVEGVARLSATLRPQSSHRGPNAAWGLLTVIAGTVVLCYPHVSLMVLTRLAGALMTISGVALIVSAVALRRLA